MILAERVKRRERNALEREGFLSAIDNGRMFALVGIAFRELVEVLAEVGVERGGRLDFRREELPSGMFDHVHLNAIGVSVEVEVGTFACIERLLHLFENDKVLEKSAAKRIVRQLLDCLDSRQGAGEPSVVEIEFGRFYEPFSPILVPRRKEKADVRRMEDGEPFRYRLCGDSTVVRNGRDVENGSDASHDELEEGFEDPCVFDVQKLMDVTFHVCADVAGEECIGLYATCKDTRIPAVENRRHRIGIGMRRRGFLQAKRKERMDGAPSGERLADTLHQEKVAGTCKDEKSVLLFVINDPLNVGKQLGNTLHFVEDGPVRKFREKGRGVSLCVFAGTGMLKRFVGLFREKRLYKRRFSRLPRADNRDHGKILCGFPCRSCHESFDFHRRQYSTPHTFMQYGK